MNKVTVDEFLLKDKQHYLAQGDIVLDKEKGQHYIVSHSEGKFFLINCANGEQKGKQFPCLVSMTNSLIEGRFSRPINAGRYVFYRNNEVEVIAGEKFSLDY